MTSPRSTVEVTTGPERRRDGTAPGWLHVVLVLLVVLGVLAMHALVTMHDGDAMLPDGGSVHVEGSGVVAADRSGIDPSRHAMHFADMCLLMLSGLGTAWLLLVCRDSRVDRGSQRPERRCEGVPSLPGPAPPPGRSHLELAVILR
jgi:hypothetical protein